MKRLFYYIVFFCIMTSCGILCSIPKEDFRTKTLIDKEFIQRQLDSLCVADTLSCDFNDWEHGEFISYNTNDTVRKYVWVKQWDDGTLIKYVVTGTKEPFLVEKTETYNANRKK